MSLDELTHEEVATFYVFHLRMVLGVVGHIDGRFVVDVQIRRRVVFQVELTRERARWTASVEASDAATISASHEERAILFCFLEDQEMAA